MKLTGKIGWANWQRSMAVHSRAGAAWTKEQLQNFIEITEAEIERNMISE